MVDCGSQQCVKKGRILKKELLAWTKKVPILLGTEEAASAVLGRKRTNRLLEPFKRLEPQEPTDWIPQLNCSFCDAKSKFTVTLLHERVESLKSGSAFPPIYQKYLDMLPPPPKHSPTHCDHANHTYNKEDHHFLSAYSHRHDHHNHQQQYSSNQYNGNSISSYSNRGLLGSSSLYDIKAQPMSPAMINNDSDQPLDLSASSKSSYSNCSKLLHRKDKPTLKVPLVQTNQSKKKDSRDGKRQYTEEELNAAVTDIRSGKLGTRRAAALYGIPRSTLRNKIFRLENNRDQQNRNAEKSASSKNSSDVTSKPSESITPRPPFLMGMPDLLSQHMPGSSFAAAAAAAATAGIWFPDQWLTESWHEKLQALRKKHDLNAGLERPFGMPPLFYDSQLMMECDKAFSLSNPFEYDKKLPFLQDLVHKFAEQRVASNDKDHETDSDATIDEKKSDESEKPNKELKIPTYKPLQLSSKQEDEKSGSKLPADLPLGPSSFFSPFGALPLASAYMNTFDNLGMTSTSSFDGSSSPKKSRLESKQPSSPTKSARDSPKKECTKSSDSKSSNKKSRPKRGQYRRYNHELLMEAVKAVQRGEMSVHRAGSYYGVPHSTLEYKVKERHLLRNKKPGSKKNTYAESGSSSANDNSNGADGINMDSNSTEEESTSKPPSPCPADENTSPTKSGTLKLAPFMIKEEKSEDTDAPSSSSPADINPDVSAILSGSSSSAGPSYLNAIASAGFPALAPIVPLGFGWPPLIPGSAPGLPLGLPDPSSLAAAAAYSEAFSSLNMSASDLLKKLHKQVETGSETPDEEVMKNLADREPGELFVK